MKLIVSLSFAIASLTISAVAQTSRINESDQLARYNVVHKVFKELVTDPKSQVLMSVFQRIGQDKLIVVRRKRRLSRRLETQRTLDLSAATAEALAGIRQENKKRRSRRLDFGRLYNVYILHPCKSIGANFRMHEHYIDDIALMQAPEVHQLINEFKLYVDYCVTLDAADEKRKIRKEYLKMKKLKNPQIEVD